MFSLLISTVGQQRARNPEKIKKTVKNLKRQK